jgi:hypothetical protein
VSRQGGQTMRRNMIVILTLITVAIHIYFFTTGTGSLFTLFLLNALGYLGLLGLLYLPLGLPTSIKRLVRPIFIGYTILTILLYIVISASSGIWSFPLAPIAKVDELILIWQLWAEARAPKVNEQPAT